MIAVCALFAEGAVFDWSGIFLARETNSGEGIAALGLAVFSLTSAAGRLVGDTAAARLGSAVLARVGSVGAAAGLTLATVVATPPAGLAGFAIMGLGLSVVFPLTLRAAGQAGAQHLAAVSAVGYTGFLAGPPLIGLLAELSGLRTALGLVVAACLLAALLTPTLTSDTAPAALR